MRKKMRYGLPFAVVAGAITVGSVAWACTPQNGNTFITTPNCRINPCEVRRGNTIMAHARFVDPSVGFNNYELYLSVQRWCHNDSKNHVLAADQVSDANWNIPGTAGVDLDNIADGDNTKHADNAGVIPLTWPTGTYDVCYNNGQGTDTTQSSNSSYPVALTVKK